MVLQLEWRVSACREHIILPSVMMCDMGSYGMVANPHRAFNNQDTIYVRGHKPLFVRRSLLTIRVPNAGHCAL